jgi:hypothetical protein
MNVIGPRRHRADLLIALALMLVIVCGALAATASVNPASVVPSAEECEVEQQSVTPRSGRVEQRRNRTAVPMPFDARPPLHSPRSISSTDHVPPSPFSRPIATGAFLRC